MSKTNRKEKSSRHKCVKCGKKRDERFMIRLERYSRRFSCRDIRYYWRCDDCNKTYYNGVVSDQSVFRDLGVRDMK